MATFALQARWVLPITSPPIEGGIITVSDQRIVAVGTKAEAGAKVQDLGDVVLMPGLVNAHTHLEFSDLAEPLGKPNSALPDWIRLVIANRKQQVDPVAVVEAGIAESIRSGVTSIGEISTSPFQGHSSLTEPEVVAFQEVIGFSAARVESVLVDLKERLSAKSLVSRLGVSPHAPYTVHPNLLEKLVELAVERRLPVAMHLAESNEELQLLQENAGPFRELLEERSMWDETVFATTRRPLDYLRVLCKAPRALVVHGNYLSRDEMTFIASHQQMTVVYCPRTHAYFGHSKYPLQEMLDCGVSLAIGTDSRASNPDLRLLAELRHVAQAFGVISPQEIVALGTIRGAKALDLTQDVGSLEVGKLANLTAIEWEPAMGEPYAAVLFGEQQMRETWIRGELAHSASS